MPKEVHIRSPEQSPHYSDVDHEVLPLGPKGFDLRYRWARYGDLGLHSEFFGSRTRFHEVQHGETVYFGLIIPRGDPVRFLGAQLTRPSLVVWQGYERVEYDYVMEAGAICHIVEVTASVARNRGLVYSPRSVWDVRQDAVAGYVGMLKRLMNQHDHQPETALSLKPDVILDGLDFLTGGALFRSAGISQSRLADRSAWRLIKQAESLLVENAGYDALSGDQICKALGVSRRTLYAAFKKQLGIGPSKLQTLLRLYRLRHLLMAEPLESGTVSRLAHEVGFTHLGRMSGAYKAQFGEAPSETLRRSN